MQSFTLRLKLDQRNCSRYVLFGFQLITSATKVKEEILIYPLVSFVSDLGGSLGLFVGFSFLNLWDFFDFMLVKCKRISTYFK